MLFNLYDLKPTRRTKAPKLQPMYSTHKCRRSAPSVFLSPRSWPEWRRRHAVHLAGCSQSSYGEETCEPRGMSDVVPRHAASTHAASRRSREGRATAGRAWPPGRTTTGHPSDTSARSCRPPARRSVKTTASRGRM